MTLTALTSLSALAAPLESWERALENAIERTRQEGQAQAAAHDELEAFHKISRDAAQQRYRSSIDIARFVLLKDSP